MSCSLVQILGALYLSCCLSAGGCILKKLLAHSKKSDGLGMERTKLHVLKSFLVESLKTSVELQKDCAVAQPLHSIETCRTSPVHELVGLLKSVDVLSNKSKGFADELALPDGSL